MKTLLLFFVSFIFSLTLFAQENVDVVYLKNGSKIKGVIIEQVPNVSLKIKTADGSLFVFKIEEIEKITKESAEENNNEISPQTLSKQNTGFFVNINGGATFPLGMLNSGAKYVVVDAYGNYFLGIVNWGIGWCVGGNFGYVFNNILGTRIDFSYNNYAVKDVTLQGQILSGVSGGSFTDIGLGGDFMIGNFNKNSKIIPYGFIGLRAFFKSIGNATYQGYNITVLRSETKFGMAVGGGIDFKVAKNVDITAESKFNLGFGNDPITQTIPIKIGVLFNF